MTPQSSSTASPAQAGALLSPDFLARLQRLELVSRRLFAGRFKGERRTRNRGTSVEFADYRNYVFGDEPRFVDWNTYARLGRLFLKLFVEEEDLSVHFLIDASASMGIGDPQKLRYGVQAAAAMAYVSLLSQDRVSLGAFSTDNIRTMRPRRGRSAAMEIFDFLASLEPAGSTSLEAAARKLAAMGRRSGLVVVVSDFLDRAGYETALGALLHRRCEVVALHVISPEDEAPSLAGDLRLVDVEEGDAVEITASERLLRHYRTVFADWSAGLQQFCRARGISYIPARTGVPFEDLVLKTLRAAGLMRG